MLQVLTFQVTPFAQNCRVLFSENRNCIVCDPGAEAELIYKNIEKLDLMPQAIILTHGHHDHCAAAGELSRLLNVEIYGPAKEDAVWLDHVAEQSKMFGLPPADNIKTDHYLVDGQELDFGLDEPIKVLLCPGHTPGQVCYYFANSGILLSGDVLFAGSVGRSDFMYGDPEALINGINEKLMTLPENTKVLPGHGPDTTIERERHCNPFLTPDIY